MKDMEFIKAFSCFSRQTYYETIRDCEKDVVDRVTFGNYSADGNGCEYELSMTWMILRQDKPASPCLELFNDSFKSIEEHAELFKELTLLHGKSFTPDDFSQLLLRLGYKDLSDKELA